MSHFVSKPVQCVVAFLLIGVIAGCGKVEYSVDEHLARAAEALAKRNVAKAVVELKAAVQMEPDSVEARLALSKLYVHYQNNPPALKELDRAVDLGLARVIADPLAIRALLQMSDIEGARSRLDAAEERDTSAELLSLGGEILLEEEAFEGAAQSFARALEVEPTHAYALLGLARIALRDNDRDSARKHLDASLAADDNNFRAHMVNGELNLFEREFEAALSAFKRAEEINQLLPMPLVSQARVHIEMDDYDGSHAILQRAAKNFPNLKYVRFYQGVTNFKAEQFEQAEGAFRDVLAVIPDHLMSQFYLGLLTYRTGHLEQAEQFLGNFIKAYPNVVEVRKILSSIQLLRGHPELALETLEADVEAIRTDPDLSTLKARALFESGDATGGVQALRNASTISPGDKKLATWVTLAEINAGAIDEALEALVAAGESDADLHGGLMQVYALLRKSELPAALELVDRLIVQFPSSAATHNARGMIFLARADIDAARDAFSAATIGDDLLPAALVNLTLLELENGNLPAARERVTEMLLKDENAEVSLVLAGRIEAADGNFADAIAYFEKAVAAEPASIEARQRLARYYLSSNQLDQAFVYIDELYKLAPTDPNILGLHGAALLLKGRVPDAAKAFERGLAQFPNEPSLNIAAGDAYLRLGEIERAQKAYEVANQVAPGSLPAAFGLARILIRTNEHQRAKELIGKVAELDPDGTSAPMLEAELATVLGNTAEAVAAYTVANDRLTTPETIIPLANAQVSQGRVDDALKTLQQGHDDFPDDDKVLAMLAELHRATGKAELAESHYREYLSGHPQSVEVLNNLAYLLISSNPQESIEFARKAHELAPNSVSVLDTYGWVLAKNNEYEQALSLLQQAADSAPELGEVGYHLAVAYARSGDKRKAVKELDRILAGTPFASSEEAEELRAALRN